MCYKYGQIFSRVSQQGASKGQKICSYMVQCYGEFYLWNNVQTLFNVSLPYADSQTIKSCGLWSIYCSFCQGFLLRSNLLWWVHQGKYLSSLIWDIKTTWFWQSIHHSNFEKIWKADEAKSMRRDIALMILEDKLGSSRALRLLAKDVEKYHAGQMEVQIVEGTSRTVELLWYISSSVLATPLVNIHTYWRKLQSL